MNDIRSILCDEIEKLRENKTTAANVNAIVNASGKILSTIKLDMEFAKLVGKQPKNSFVQLEEKVTISPEAHKRNNNAKDPIIAPATEPTKAR